MAPTTPMCHFDTLGASSHLLRRSQRPPMSHYDSLGVFLRPPPPTTEQTPQHVEMTRWGFPLAFDAGHNDPQRVIMTRWWFSFGHHPQQRNKRPQRVSMTRWVLGKFFFLFYSFYVDTNLCFIYSSDRICDRVGNRNKNSRQ